MANRKRALAVSGGDAQDAWAVGARRYLCRDRHRRFDTVVGAGTGALIAPLAAPSACGEAAAAQHDHVTAAADSATPAFTPGVCFVRRSEENELRRIVIVK